MKQDGFNYRFTKIMSLGLSSEYNKQDSEIFKYFTYIFCLPLLDPWHAGDCFAFRLNEIQSNIEAVFTFADYLVENYSDKNA